MFRPPTCLGRLIAFDLSEVRRHLAPVYSSTGRPSIDPELLVRMLLVEHAVTGGDAMTTTEFLQELADLLRRDQIEVIEKRLSGNKTIFLSMPVAWNGGVYVAFGAGIRLKGAALQQRP